MEAWIIFTVAAAFLQNLRNGMQKSLNSVLSISGAAYTRFAFGLPLAFIYWIFLISFSNEQLNWGWAFWIYSFVGGLAQVLAMVSILLSFSLRGFTVGTAYAKIETLMTAFFTIMLLGEEKPTLNFMEQLKDDYSIWLLSNTNPQHIRDEIDIRYEFPKHIDGAVYSFDVGYRKPHKSIYLRALELADSNAEHSLFIDDLKENIDAAKSVGMHGIHFQSVEQLEKDLIMMGLIPQKEAFV